MMVFWKAGLVILAVPKTGSAALEAALAPHADMAIRFPPFYRHMPLAWYETSFRSMFRPEDAAGLETLAVVREPVDWLSSWYRYRRRADLDGSPRSTRGLGFAAFVEAWLRPQPPPFADVGRQSRFCAGRAGSAGVDHLFAYEAPGPLHAFLEARTGLAVAPERRNVSPEGDTALPETLAARLRHEAAAEFALHARARERARAAP